MTGRRTKPGSFASLLPDRSYSHPLAAGFIGGALIYSVDEIEKRTGYDLLANVPKAVQDAIEAGTNKTVIQSVYVVPSI